MNSPAEHRGDTSGSQPLREGEKVVIQVPAACGKRQMKGKADGELDRQRTTCRGYRRGSQSLGVIQEAAQPDLARAAAAVCWCGALAASVATMQATAVRRLRHRENGRITPFDDLTPRRHLRRRAAGHKYEIADSAHTSGPSFLAE